MVGGFATGLHYLLMALFFMGFGVPVVISSALGFTISAVVNYLLNARFTFESSESHKKTLPRFVITALTGLLVNTVVLSILVSLGFNAIVSQTLSTVGVLSWNYCINSIWTFKKKKNQDPVP